MHRGTESAYVSCFFAAAYSYELLRISVHWCRKSVNGAAVYSYVVKLNTEPSINIPPIYAINRACPLSGQALLIVGQFSLLIDRIYPKLIANSREIHWRFIAMCFHSPSRERGKEVRK